MLFYNTVKNLYREFIFKRCDDEGLAYYYSEKDFEGIMTESYEFSGKNGQILRGKFYYYDNFNPDRIIVFDHGMGGGHLSYMREIEMLARHGYKVFSYDHTGCMQSEGDSTVGFSQSLCDLDCCLKSLKSDGRFKEKSLSVIGHSWGGYAVLNISSFHPDLTHIVVLSGFTSVSKISERFGALKKYIYEIEKESNPEYVECDGVKSLRNTQAKVLFVYSDNDAMVNKELNFDYLKTSLSERKDTFFILEKGKSHNPNYTVEAVGVLNDYLAKLNKTRKSLKTPEQKKTFVDSFDWDKMTQQDEKIWNRIFEVFDN